jgi:DNA modification methylase
MAVKILIGDVRERLAQLPADSFDCCVTSPPYWGLRNYDVDGQLGLEPTLGEHLAVMVEVFRAVRRVLKPEGTLWVNYGDCYATTPNGRSAAATKAAGTDDRTFRDKPFSTIGAISAPREPSMFDDPPAVARLKPKDLCMVPNRLAIALQEDGWWVRSENIWGKLNPMPDSSGRYRPSGAHEKVWHLTKSAKSYYNSEAVRMPSTSGGSATYKNPDGWDTGPGAHGSVHRSGREKGMTAAEKRPRGSTLAPRHAGHISHTTLDQTPRGEGRLLRQWEPDLSSLISPDVWPIAIHSFREAHFATFPPELVVPCILAGSPPGGSVLDPFGGAGTTALVAQAMGRDATLIELNPDYAAIAEKRIMHGNVGLAMPDYEGGPR